MISQPSLLVVHHFFHPDDVVSAREYSDLAQEHVRRGWRVTVLTGNRSYANPREALPRTETWRGIKIIRSYRPPWSQAGALPRLANSAWLTSSWLLEALKAGPFDAIVIGSEPAFAPLLVLPLKALWPEARFVHWCFDMYPEAIEAEGLGRLAGVLVPLARRMMRSAYRRYDSLVDIGPRMAERLRAYGAEARQMTLVPWALVEPTKPLDPSPPVRASLFPRARLGLLYSGTMGRAHEYELLLELARRCRARSGDKVSLCFSCRGNRLDQLRSAITAADTNISLAPFCSEADLALRLGAADLHAISLKAQWSGIVVPSKFFGSLAAGKPVIYAGSPDSDIARWIDALDVGFVLSRETLDTAVDRLHQLLDDDRLLRMWSQKAFDAYRTHFSKHAVTDAWASLLRSVVDADSVNGAHDVRPLSIR